MPTRPAVRLGTAWHCVPFRSSSSWRPQAPPSLSCPADRAGHLCSGGTRGGVAFRRARLPIQPPRSRQPRHVLPGVWGCGLAGGSRWHHTPACCVWLSGRPWPVERGGRSERCPGRRFARNTQPFTYSRVDSFQMWTGNGAVFSFSSHQLIGQRMPSSALNK